MMAQNRVRVLCVLEGVDEQQLASSGQHELANQCVKPDHGHGLRVVVNSIVTVGIDQALVPRG